MFLAKYFDLGLFPEEPLLGMGEYHEPAKRRKEAKKRIWLTILMYLGVWVGTFVEKLMELHEKNISFSLSNMNITNTILALVLASVTFPQVFPRAFSRMPRTARYVETIGWRVVQVCVAFQQGFSWQVLISFIIRS